MVAERPGRPGRDPQRSNRSRSISGRRRRPGPAPVKPEKNISAHLAFLFPGQGSQYVGMGKKLVEAYPAAAEIFAKADEILGFSLSQICFEGPEAELRRTVNAQPALLTCSVAVLRVLWESGLQPDIVAGHSLGEFTAWVAAESLDFATTLRLVRKRAELMEAAAHTRPGGMLAVLGLPPKLVQQLIDRANAGVLVMANINCPGQIVASGEEPALRRLKELVLQEEGGRAIPLRVSGGFHSPLMAQAAKLFKAEVEKLSIAPASIPVVANSSARPVTAVPEIRQAMTEQMTSSVLWEDTLRTLAQSGVKQLVEAGPGEVLSGLVKRTLENVTIIAAGEPEKLSETLGLLGPPAGPEATPPPREETPPDNQTWSEENN